MPQKKNTGKISDAGIEVTRINFSASTRKKEKVEKILREPCAF
jgi:hypothetical protein